MATLCADCRMPVRPVNECICDDDPGLEATPDDDGDGRTKAA